MRTYFSLMAVARDIAARVRAARAFSDLDQQVVADRLQVSVATLRRIERGDRVATRGELRELAELTQVPLSFLTDGWEGPTPAQLEEQRIEAFEAELREQAARHHEITEMLNMRLASVEARMAENPDDVASRRQREDTAAQLFSAQEAAHAAEAAAAELRRQHAKKPRAS